MNSKKNQRVDTLLNKINLPDWPERALNLELLLKKKPKKPTDLKKILKNNSAKLWEKEDLNKKLNPKKLLNKSPKKLNPKKMLNKINLMLNSLDYLNSKKLNPPNPKLKKLPKLPALPLKWILWLIWISLLKKRNSINNSIT